ncbi:MAG: ATP-grasp domain-containing protein [Acidobacteria bacterium]|nr:ATP-grasp domain-containing protein [Acidobacteriota bacterium]
MKHVIFCAPYFLPATVRFIDAVASLPATHVSLISKDPPEMLPAGIRRKLSGYGAVKNGMEPQEYLNVARALIHKHGPCHRLFGALEDLQVPLAQVREALGVEGMSTQVVTQFRDKNVMKDVLRANAVPCAKHQLAAHEAELWHFIRQVGYPIIVKPPAGAGARNTMQLRNDQQVHDYLRQFPPSAMRPALAEEFIQGQEHSFDSICIRGQMVWHSITRYYPTPLEVLENPWIQWCILLPRDISGSEYDPIRRAAQHALKALGMGTGLSHMEWFRRSDGSVAISEVGARPPGAQITTLHSFAHDIDLYKAWAKVMVYEQFDVPRRKYSVGAAYLRGQGSGRIKAVHGLDQAQREVGKLVIEAKLPQAGQKASGTYEGDGYVIMRHPDTEVVKAALKQLISTVRVEMES